MRTAQEIVDETNMIARIIYSSRGYDTAVNFKFYEESRKRHPHEEACWAAACEIQQFMTGTDPEDAIEELEDE